MRTKNKKWTVPILAIVPVLALAAFLAAGFLTANTAQALDDDECGFVIDGNGGSTISAMKGEDSLGSAACFALENAIDIIIENHRGPNPNQTTVPFNVYVSGGSDYPKVVLDPITTGTDERTAGTGVDEHPVDVAGPNARMIPGKATITVSRSMAEKGVVIVEIYDVFTGLDGLDGDSVGITTADAGASIAIVFLGDPTVGEDGEDPGSGVSDVNQCLVGDDGDPSVGNTIPPVNADDCGDDDDVFYAAESRSKLISETKVSDDEPPVPEVKKVSLGGKPANHTISGGQDSVTITALIQDASGNPLIGQDVDFAPSSDPPSLVGTRIITVETEAADQDDVADDNRVAIGDAIAQREFSNLPDDVGFKITVAVTAGGVNIGSIVIARSGALDSVTAEACVMGDNDDDMDGCMDDYKPKNLYEAGGAVTIHAAAADSLGNEVAITNANWSLEAATAESWWNTLDCPQMNDAVMPMDDEPAVGPDDMTSPYCKMYDGLSDEAEAVVDRAFSAYGDADDVVNTDNVDFTSDAANFRIRSNAPGGKYVFIVEGKTGSDSTERTATDTVYIIVSGELVRYIASGENRILGGGIQTYTVTAADANGNPAALKDEQLTGDDNDIHIVSVFLDGDTGMVRSLGLDSENKLDLGTDAQATFRIRANRGASGDIAITIDGAKDIPMEPEDGKIVRLGANMMPMAGDAIADQTIDMGATVMVQSTLSDPEDAMLYYAWSSDDEMIATVMADDMDMSMATITGVAVGSAMITVTATDSEGGEGMQTFMVTVEEANVAPMAGDAIADQMMTVGDDPMMVATMFTDANMDDMLIYSAMSDKEMVATAMVDMDGMVTITAVGAGEATITVTATDMDGAYAMQTIMVTVAANMPPMGGDAIEVMMTMGDDPMMVEAMFTDAENDMLSYSVMSSDDMVATATVDDMGMVTITAMGAGMATITVTATDTQGGMGTQEIMVTVMMMPPMELGDPVVTGTMSDATGMATIMLTPGANAGQHWIWAQPTDRSEGMFSEKVAGDATSANMTGLTSGMSYWFTAVAGRDMEDGPTEWSEYSGWSAETPIQ